MVERGALVLSVLIALSALGCARRVGYGQPTYTNTYAAPPAQPAYVQTSGYQASAEAQLLYLPVGGLAATLVQSVVVQSQDGQVYQLGPSDLAPALAGRLALRLPAGVITGTVTLHAMGQSLTIPFHVAAQVGGGQVIGTAPPPASPACAIVAGRWIGNITSDRDATTVVDLEILPDCRTVRGFVHLDSPQAGSVDSTITGTWDPSQYHLVAQDTQLFNVRPHPGGSFCPTARYDLQLQQDGALAGQNIVTDPNCRGASPVHLYRQ